MVNDRHYNNRPYEDDIEAIIGEEKPLSDNNGAYRLHHVKETTVMEKVCGKDGVDIIAITHLHHVVYLVLT